MIAPRFLLCIVAALAMHTWPAHADALSDAFNQGATLGRSRQHRRTRPDQR
jgi:hypothetical protein